MQVKLLIFISTTRYYSYGTCECNQPYRHHSLRPEGFLCHAICLQLYYLSIVYLSNYLSVLVYVITTAYAVAFLSYWGKFGPLNASQNPLNLSLSDAFYFISVMSSAVSYFNPTGSMYFIFTLLLPIFQNFRGMCYLFTKTGEKPLKFWNIGRR